MKDVFESKVETLKVKPGTDVLDMVEAVYARAETQSLSVDFRGVIFGVPKGTLVSEVLELYVTAIEAKHKTEMALNKQIPRDTIWPNRVGDFPNSIPYDYSQIKNPLQQTYCGSAANEDKFQ